jgi:hypothetical protein
LALIGCALSALIFFGGGYLFNLSEVRELLRPFRRHLLNPLGKTFDDEL